MGSGFFLGSPVDDFWHLCTCKHVIAESDEAREAVNSVQLLLTHVVDGHLDKTLRTVPLRTDDGQPRWRQHPDPDVDVFVLRVMSADLAGTQVQPVPVDLLPSPNQLAQTDVQPGDQLVVLGYPGGRLQYPSARPIYRAGVLGTPAGGRLRVRTKEGYAVVPAFWVDGMMVPGNSGGPVVLRPERSNVVNGQVMPYVTPPYVMGLIAGCDYAQVDEVPAPVAAEQDLEEAEKKKVFAGLALAMNAETITSTMALF